MSRLIWRRAQRAVLIKERHNPAVQTTALDDILKLRHRCDQVPATTFGYGNRTMPAVRVERFVEWLSG
jgi:hypothetical protein